MATGGGKTLCFCTILKSSFDKGKKAIMVVHGRELIEQASQRLFREGVEHGVMMANHWNVNPRAHVQVCSIDTLARRKVVPEADIVIIDECHMATSNSFKWLLEQYRDQFVLGVSATPHAKNGLRHVGDEVVRPITIAQLIEQGFLVAPKYYAPTKVDLSSVKIDSRTGDYQNKSLSDTMENAKIFGDICKAYIDHARGRPAICFAVSVKHSKMLQEEFVRNGIAAEHIDASTSQEDRKAAFARLESKDTEVLCSVGVLTTGVDIPCIGAIIMARPTKSYNLYIQMLGRGTRTYPGKENFLVLDHANTIKEHGFIEDELDCNLDGEPKREPSEKTCTCDKCYLVFSRDDHGYVCSECGHDNTPQSKPRGERELLHAKEYSMIELSVGSNYDRLIIENFIAKKVTTALRYGRKPGWVYHQVAKAHGKNVAKRYWRKIQQQVGVS